MKTETGEFSFTVPKGHPEAGNVYKRTFPYQVAENETEALAVMTEKELTITDVVNKILFNNAKSNAYQTATLPYKPVETPQDEIDERMVRDYIRSGFSEDEAREMVAANKARLAAKKAEREAAASEPTPGE